MSKRAFVLVSILLGIVAPRLSAQGRGAAALGEAIDGLGTTARVLMIGAHPDDEDTQLIAWLAKARHVETAYLSLTRGDGGQNLIGNELGDGLGMIRTEELLAARRIDGGRQYFTRAFDFGFSKTLDETLQHWPKDSILEDVVAIVRAFRPQVIIAVFSGTPADGHGHHQYSAVIAREVFDAAADSVRFPAARLGGLQPWTPLKFYRLARGGGGTLNVQCRRVRSVARRDVLRDRDRRVVRSTARKAKAGCRNADRASAACDWRSLACRTRRRRSMDCSTASTRAGRDSSRCGLRIPFEARSTRWRRRRWPLRARRIRWILGVGRAARGVRPARDARCQRDYVHDVGGWRESAAGPSLRSG